MYCRLRQTKSVRVGTCPRELTFGQAATCGTQACKTLVIFPIVRARVVQELDAKTVEVPFWPRLDQMLIPAPCQILY